ncbi:hypothetical protein M5689_007824 [Euphorbia peplus]|nr:hypothetical protein M5689_007824 [Euphorbia peplus]
MRPTRERSRRRPKSRDEKKGRREDGSGDRDRATVIGKENRKSAVSSRRRSTEDGRYEWKREWKLWDNTLSYFMRCRRRDGGVVVAAMAAEGLTVLMRRLTENKIQI